MVNNILIEVLSTFAEQERLEIRERRREGIAAMKANGEWERYGRPRKMADAFPEFLKKQKDGMITVSEGCEALGISKTQWYRLANAAN